MSEGPVVSLVTLMVDRKRPVLHRCLSTKVQGITSQNMVILTTWPVFTKCRVVALHLLRSYQRINPGSRHVAVFRNYARFYGEEFLAPRPTPGWTTTPCRLPATAYSIYSQLSSILEAVPPSVP